MLTEQNKQQIAELYSKRTFSLKKFLLVIIIVPVIFFIGVYTGQLGNTTVNTTNDYGQVVNIDSRPAYLTKNIDFNLLWQTWNLLKSKYLHQDKLNEVELFYGALAGSVAALRDPYTVFFDPKVALEFTEELSGQFQGIGAEIGIKDNHLTIIAPLPGTPAEKAGIQSGDKIIAINQLDTTNISVDKAVSLIRGEKGTKVSLIIVHASDNQPIKLEIARDVIKIVSVSWQMKENKIAYLKITHFNQDTGERFKEAVNQIINQGAQKLIVDLRNNPGGFLDVAIELGGYWLDDQVMVKEMFYDATKNKDYKTVGNPILKSLPTVVLVNGGSASASEILAGALQDYKLATVIGETTFGKGSVQELENLSDGSAIKITVAEWRTPNNRVINEKGVEPDIKVERNYEDPDDNQLKEALKIINQ
ncbi:MAG: S41 family peptidase [Candidatus Komeilibacteria bacterium CG_4_10_14_0_2_um_filter_37_10]|uniref:S41 family peptidase n=1 Tax=Candidatus Komeilibacteria bacterium CG_4_10_14_0_2_um_filter_37_10 TaxID=1974470 RepID=A0A2M7VE15_9BACT|nr:MAG: S41 family peptidase [Candidatus Komeilibacteria bacterium CG_4_10_14_0_2_um_filter_37_10]PJA92831.1 MAG: S41 family peptidase [Candidatus Komeilibacteria bacterium CG_4_9_14_3_um_filter_37_5]